MPYRLSCHDDTPSNVYPSKEKAEIYDQGIADISPCCGLCGKNKKPPERRSKKLKGF
jgi:hypothetical protein